MLAQLTLMRANQMPAGARGSRPRGQLRARKILETAQKILTDEGYHSLTLRRIASIMGISNGNVTYYFANKQQLLSAMIAYNLARYDAEFEREAIGFPNHPKARLRAYFKFLIDDAQNPESQRFFYQLWALASHNAEAAVHRDGVYEHFLEQVRSHLSAARPELEEAEILRKGFMLMSLIEGLNVLYGSGAELQAKFGDPSAWILEQIMELIES